MSADRPQPATTQTSGGSTGAADTSYAQALPAGTRIGHYTIRRTISRGGMGATIYEAIQDAPQRLVALKVLPWEAGAEALDRFRREADALAMVKHRNVVSVFESGKVPAADGAAFIAMELVVGAQTLDAYVRDREATLTLRDRVRLMTDVCSAVAEAHRIGLVHRDLKPGNILVGADGVPKLVDFGITTAVNSEVIAAPLPPVAMPPHGTPSFMSPEQARGDAGAIDARSDVYSLGAILFEILTSRPLRRFDKSASGSGTWIATVLATSPTPPSKWIPKLKGDADRVVLRALENEPSKRFADAGEFEQALRDLLDDAAPRGADEPTAKRLARGFRNVCRTFPRFTALAAIVLGATIGLLVLDEPALFNSLGFDRIEPALVRAAAPKSTVGPMSTVAMVVLDDEFDSQQLGDAMKHHGINSDPTLRESMRRLDAKLIDRLVDSGAKAIAIDLAMTVATDGDAELAAAAKRAAASGVPVLAVAVDWNEQTGIAPGLRDAFRLGGALAEIGTGAWELNLAHKTGPGVVAPSLALGAWLAARAPGSRWEVALELPATITVRAFNPASGLNAQSRPMEVPGETLTIEATSIAGPRDRIATPENPLDARLRVIIPDDEVLRRSTVRFADVVGPKADPVALRAALSGRIALVGDLRRTGEPRHKYFDGRQLPAFYVNAVAIESLGNSMRSDAFTFAVLALPIALVASSCLGVGLARLWRTWRLTLAGGAALVVMALFVMSVAFASASYATWLVNPGPLFVAGVSGFFVYRAVRHLSRLPLT